MREINPFKPTAGMNPPELIGRDMVLGDFRDALDNGPAAPDRLTAHFGPSEGWARPFFSMRLETSPALAAFRLLTLPPALGSADRILGALTRRREVSGLTVSPSMFLG